MLTKFKEDKRKSLLIGVIDNRKLYASGWATEVSINMSDYFVQRCMNKEYDVFISDDENEILKSSSDYSHVLIVAMGMSLKLSDRLFSALESLCKQEFFIAGHILHRNEKSYFKNSYYELHHQFYVVNVAEYFSLNCPFVGTPIEEEHIQIEPLRSEECLYNDHEVAAWIKPGNVKKTYERKLHGWNIIATAMEHDKKIIDLGKDIRENKKYVYYEYDHVFLKEVSEIYWNQFFCNNFFAGWNSDLLKEKLVSLNAVEQYITVGIGVYWVYNLHKIGTTKNTKVVFTDINQSCLLFMKKMVEEWDGKDYAEFYKNNMSMLPNNTLRDIDEYIKWTDVQWKEFLSKFKDWDKMWEEVRKLKFEYVLIDYMSAYDLSWIERDKNTIINLSDVFTHVPYVATQSLKYRVACENRLITSLKNVNPEIVMLMTSRAADGYHPIKSRTMYGMVKDFDLTDINELKKPDWHSVDWSSPRILG